MDFCKIPTKEFVEKILKNKGFKEVAEGKSREIINVIIKKYATELKESLWFMKQ